MKSKKAQIEQLVPLVTSLIGIGIVLVIGFLIITAAEDQVANSAFENGSCGDELDNYSCNGTIAVREAMAQIPGWLPIIVITTIGALLLGLVNYFRTR